MRIVVADAFRDPALHLIGCQWGLEPETWTEFQIAHE
jgi:hypothetical protein